jgi:hypothetical protein
MIGVVLLLLAFLCFVLAACQAPIPRVNLTAAGLALWVVTELLPHLSAHP